MGYAYTSYAYTRPPGLTGIEPRHRVAIVGAGPIGLAMAVDLAQRGVRSVVLDDNNQVSTGSRAICWAKRTLEIFDRLGVGARMVEKGITWQTGRLFHGQAQVYHFDLLPEEGHKMPAFINLQQYYVEEYLIERCGDFADFIDLRWKNKVVDHADRGDYVHLHIETPDGHYTLEADYLLACDGARSPTRTRMGLNFAGETFEERFLIADIHMPQNPFEADGAERWFWFKPPFHQGQSALLHKQPDDIYRIDLQLGFEADPELEKRSENVIPRIRALVGDTPFTLDWVSVYSFTCARLQNFIHNRVIFAGDSAHIVSPFGARGGNGGIQDIDNLGWKLAAVVEGRASVDLLATYDEERGNGADENILNSARATNFMTPKSPTEHAFRDAVLELAETQDFARHLVNSGRLSTPCSLTGLSLQSGDHPLVGRACPDVPLEDGWLLSRLFSGSANTLKLLAPGHWSTPEVALERVNAPDQQSTYQLRYGPGAFLIRPDQHIAAHFMDEADLAKHLPDALAPFNIEIEDSAA